MIKASHDITGVGPVREDGSVEIYTVLRYPFVATADMLEAFKPHHPKVGDQIVVDEDDKLSLQYTDFKQPQGDEPAAVEEAEKKTSDSEQPLENGSDVSQAQEQE